MYVNYYINYVIQKLDGILNIFEEVLNNYSYYIYGIPKKDSNKNRP